MEKFIILISIFLLTGSLLAQEESKPFIFSGIYYETAVEDKDVSTVIGDAFSLGGNFWGLTYGEVGDESGTINIETLWTPIKGKFWIGPLLGADYVVEAADDRPTTSYLVMATGVAAGYWFKDVGIWAGWKWLEDFDNENSRESYGTFGLGLTFDI